MISFFYLYSTRERLPNDPMFSGAYGDRQGRYGSSSAGSFQPSGFGPLAFQSLGGLDGVSLVASGMEQAGSTYISLLAPAASRSFSPTTTLIEWAQNQDAVKRALGLDNGVFVLLTNPDLLRYDAVAALASTDEEVRREGARVAAANLRAMAVAAAVEQFGQARLDPFFFQYQFRSVGEYIASRNGAFLFDNAEMSRLLGTVSSASRYRADVISGAAHLINAYAAAIGVQVADREQAARFTLGIRGYLLDELDRLLRANSEAAAIAAQAVTTTDILAATARYREVLPFPQTGFFFPAPDFYSAPAGASLAVPASGSGNGSLTTNDFYANGPTGSIGFFPSTNQALSVSVPAGNAGQVAAELRPDETVLITPAAGFRGITYFDYVVRHSTGDLGTGRVYVTFR